MRLSALKMTTYATKVDYDRDLAITRMADLRGSGEVKFTAYGKSDRSAMRADQSGFRRVSRGLANPCPFRDGRIPAPADLPIGKPLDFP